MTLVNGTQRGGMAPQKAKLPTYIGTATPFNETNTGFPNFFVVSDQYNINTHFANALGQTPQAGDLAIKFLLGPTGADMTGLPGWTRIEPVTSVGASGFTVFAKQLTSGDLTTTWTVGYSTAGHQMTTFDVYRDLDLSSLTAGSVGASTGVTQASAPSMTAPGLGKIVTLVTGTNNGGTQYGSYSPTQDAILNQAEATDGRSFSFSAELINGGATSTTTASCSGATAGDQFGAQLYFP